MRRDVTEGRLTLVLGAELSPLPEDFGLGFGVLGSVGLGGDLQRSAEISLELDSLLRCRSCQGLSCG